MKKLFRKRLIAFLIDVSILYLLSTVVSAFVPTFGDMQKNYEAMNSVLEQLQKEDINAAELKIQMEDVTYKISKSTYLYQVANITIYILYFVVYQKKKDGQTIGKKKMNIKVRKKDSTELRYDDLLKRGALLYGLFTNLVSLGVLLFASKNVYFEISAILVYIQ